MAEIPGYDIFFSYARADNRDGKISRLVAAIEKDYARFFPDKSLRIFFDTKAIENGEDWRNRLYTGLKHSWVMVAFLSANYLASPWCRREWQAWCDIERSRGWLSYMLQPIYYVDVPDGDARMEEFLRHRQRFAEEINAHAREESGHAGSGAQAEAEFEENECLAELLSRQIVDLQPWHTDGEDALRHEEIRSRLEGLVRGLDKKIGLAARGEQSPGNIPRHNRQFRGRIHELKSIRQCFAEGEKGLVPVLHGLGGEGKSSLAFAYAHAFAYDYPGGRRQVSCAGLTDLAQCFIRLGEECGLELPPANEASPDTARAARFNRVWEWLATRPEGRALVILDNIDRPELLSQSSLVTYIQPTDAVHVLATTRCDALRIGEAAFRIELRGLPLRESAALLESFRPAEGREEQDALRRLATLLGGHALSLELAGAFLRNNPEMSWGEYAGALAPDPLAGLDETLGEAAPLVPYAGTRLRQVAQLVTPMLERLSPLEGLALSLASLLAPDEVPEPWIHKALARLQPDLLRKKGLSDPWTRGKRALTGLCLWQQSEAEGLFRMHRLVREVVRRGFSDGNDAEESETPITWHWGNAEIFRLARHEGKTGQRGSNGIYQRFQSLLRDIAREALLAHVEGRDTGGWKFHHFAALPPTLCDWFDEAGGAEACLELPLSLYHHILRWAGRPEEGLALIQKAFAIIPGIQDPAEKRAMEASYHMLEGHLQRARGDMGAARLAYHRALELLRDGPRPIEYAHCLDYAGALESATGDVDSARALHRKALEILGEPGERDAALRRERAYTLDHLACTFDPEEQAQRSEALALFTEAANIRAGLLEADADNVRALRDYGISLDFMGDCLAAGGDNAGAMDLYARSMAITEKLCELDPPSLAFLRDRSVSLNKLGDMHMAGGDSASALERYQEALHIRRGLTLADKENRSLWQDRSASHLRVGDALAALGRDPASHYQDALTIRKKLCAAQPANAVWARGLAFCREKMAGLAATRQHPAATLAETPKEEA